MIMLTNNNNNNDTTTTTNNNSNNKNNTNNNNSKDNYNEKSIVSSVCQSVCRERWNNSYLGHIVYRLQYYSAAFYREYIYQLL